MAQLKPYRGDYYLWLYIPSTPVAAVFTALFALVTAYIGWRMFRTRAWFCSVLIIGGFLEIVGYASRAAAKDKTDELIPYVIQSTFILVAPALFAASVYMVLGRVIRSVGGETLSVVPVKWLTKIFVAGDVISFVVQASGAGILATADSMKTGENIILGGLFIQIIIFDIFAVTAAIFHVRFRRHHGTQQASHHDGSWQRMMFMLYAVSILIMVRSIFRVVEYIMGHDGYLLSNEWTLYVFDAALMFAAMAIFAWQFPGHLQRKKAVESSTEMMPTDEESK